MQDNFSQLLNKNQNQKGYYLPLIAKQENRKQQPLTFNMSDIKTESFDSYLSNSINTPPFEIEHNHFLDNNYFQSEIQKYMRQQPPYEQSKRVNINENNAIALSTKVIHSLQIAELMNRFQNDQQIICNSNIKKLEDNFLERRLIINTKYQNFVVLDVFQLIPNEDMKIIQFKMELREQQHQKDITDIKQLHQLELNKINSQLKSKIDEYNVFIQQQQQQIISNQETFKIQQEQERQKYLHTIEMQEQKIQQMQQLIEQKQRSYEELEKQVKIQNQMNELLQSHIESIMKLDQIQKHKLSPISSNSSTFQSPPNIIQKLDNYQNSCFPIIKKISNQNLQTLDDESLITSNLSPISPPQNLDGLNLNQTQNYMILPQLHNLNSGGEKQQKYNFSQIQEDLQQSIIPQFLNQSEFFAVNEINKNITSPQLAQSQQIQSLPPITSQTQSNVNKIKEEFSKESEKASKIKIDNDINATDEDQELIFYSNNNQNDMSNSEKEKSGSQKHQEELNQNDQEKSIKQTAKNVPKNFIKAFKSFINSVPNRSIIKQIKNFKADSEYFSIKNKLNEIIKKNKINNEMIVFLIQNEEFSSIFQFFLENRAQDWIEESQIKDKNIHIKYLKRYQEAFTNDKYLGKIKINSKKNYQPINIPGESN